MKRMLCVVVIVLLLAVVTCANGAVVGQAIPYQGVLKNAAGTPLDGTYTVVFRLYDTSTGGTAVSTDCHSITASQGLFTTNLTFDPQYFDGRALWLGIKIGADAEMTPRQAFQLVPYAMGLRPGAVITGDETTNPSLKVINTGSNIAGLIAGTTGQNSPALFASAQGQNSPAVYGWSWNDVGIFGKGKEGGYFTTTQAGTASSPKPGVNVSTAYEYSPGIRVTTQGTSSDGIFAVARGGSTSCGLHGESLTGTGVLGISFAGNGVLGRSLSESGVYGQSQDNAGVRGQSSNDVGVYGIGKEGGYFTTNSGGAAENNVAVNISTTYAYTRGVLVNTADIRSDGVDIITHGSGSYGLSAETFNDHSNGVHTVTKGLESPGVFATTFGEYSTGVVASTNKEHSAGVYIVTQGDSSDGVHAEIYGPNSRGVYAFSHHSEGVVGEAVSAAGVKGQSADKAGIWGVSTNDVGVYAVTNRADDKYGFYTPDYLYAKGTQVPNVDVAEYMPVDENVTPGTVLVIGKGGVLTPCKIPYDTRVAGIVSTAPGVSLGTNPEGNPGEALIAVAGRVPCKVDASNGLIEEGDLLCTSDRPGYAMKAEPTMIGGRGFYPDGTILGKAMGALESETGVIEVLVTLQ